MVSQTRLGQQIDNLDVLKDLVDLVKNPKAIVDAQTIAREQEKLTAAEMAKSAEAREFISQYESMSKDLIDREAALDAALTQHEKDKIEFKAEYDAKFDGLNQRETELAQKAADLSIADANQIAVQKELDAYKVSINKEYDDLLTKLNVKSASDDKLRIANEAESKRLSEYKQSLDAKAAKFQEAAAL